MCIQYVASIGYACGHYKDEPTDLVTCNAVDDGLFRRNPHLPRDAGCLSTMKNFYISAREIYGLYILNLIETSRRNNY